VRSTPPLNVYPNQAGEAALTEVMSARAARRVPREQRSSRAPATL